MSEFKELNDEELGKVSGGFGDTDISQFTKGKRVRVRFSADNAGLGWWTYYYGTVDGVDWIMTSMFAPPTPRVKVWVDGHGSNAQAFAPENVELVD